MLTDAPASLLSLEAIIRSLALNWERTIWLEKWFCIVAVACFFVLARFWHKSGARAQNALLSILPRSPFHNLFRPQEIAARMGWRCAGIWSPKKGNSCLTFPQVLGPLTSRLKKDKGDEPRAAGGGYRFTHFPRERQAGQIV